MRILIFGIAGFLFFHCQPRDAPEMPDHEYIRLDFHAAFGTAPKTIALHRIGDSVWLHVKETGRETNPLTREKRHYAIGPDGQYDTIFYYKKLGANDWVTMDSLLVVRDFWDELPQNDAGCIDGFHFTFDASGKGRKLKISRGCPKGNIYEIGLHLIRLAGYTDEHGEPVRNNPIR
jgi:hypothetical protein